MQLELNPGRPGGIKLGQIHFLAPSFTDIMISFLWFCTTYILHLLYFLSFMLTHPVKRRLATCKRNKYDFSFLVGLRSYYREITYEVDQWLVDHAAAAAAVSQPCKTLKGPNAAASCY